MVPQELGQLYVSYNLLIQNSLVCTTYFNGLLWCTQQFLFSRWYNIKAEICLNQRADFGSYNVLLLQQQQSSTNENSHPILPGRYLMALRLSCPYYVNCHENENQTNTTKWPSHKTRKICQIQMNLHCYINCSCLVEFCLSNKMKEHLCIQSIPTYTKPKKSL